MSQQGDHLVCSVHLGKGCSRFRIGWGRWSQKQTVGKRELRDLVMICLEKSGEKVRKREAKMEGKGERGGEGEGITVSCPS